MNELMLATGNSWLYFTTHGKTVEKAVEEFYTTLEASGVNLDNFEFDRAVLSDCDGNLIEEMEL